MKTKSLSIVLLGLVAGTLPLAHSQSIVADDALTQYVLPPGITRLLLASDLQNGFAPPEAAGRVRVPPAEQVWLVAPQNWPHAIQWTKNGKPVEGAISSPLILRQVTFSDSGTYGLASPSPSNGNFPVISTRVQLDVVRDGHFCNLSARVDLRPGRDVQIVGFVVDGQTPKRLLIRTVGPSLESFGLSNSAREPRFRLLRGDGTEFIVIRPAVVLPQEYWTSLFSQAGAFPLKSEGAERPHIAYDTFDLPPGAYTVHVSDDTGVGGVALVEVYEFDSYPPLSGVK
ncbi:MAG: hypothetical protein KBA71_01030 [Opitutaceae bacterium]|nr:hypothetical protein [Opitutaceae bacterium]